MPQKLRNLVLVLLFISCLSAVSYAADVCRLRSFGGMEEITNRIHSVLGENTTDLRKIKLYVTEYNGTTYIQSNYLSVNPSTGEVSDNPTKIRSNALKDLSGALTNVIFWGKSGTEVPGAREQLTIGLANVEILLDSNLMDPHGRTEFNLSGARKVELATPNGVISTGKIELIDLQNPPPGLVELIDDCCFYGRPPGHAQALISKFSAKPVNKSNFTLLSLVTDRATESVIHASKTLNDGRARAKYSAEDSWSVRIEKAMKSSKDKALIILSHIDGTDVVVEDARGNAIFKTPLATLRKLAKDNNVELVLLGCDTASFIDDNSQPLGVKGLYNTATAARRLHTALEKSSNLAELLQGLVSKDIKLVAYDASGGPAAGYAGASAFVRVSQTNFFVRVFRMLFLKSEVNG